MLPDETARELPDLKKVQWFSAIKQTVQEFLADDAMGLGAEMAYHFLFALFPTLLMVFALLGVLDNVVRDANFSGQLLTLVQQALPTSAYDALKPVIETTVQKSAGAGAILGIGFLLTIWSASSGSEALMKGFNVAYDSVETRNFIKTKATALGLTVTMAVLVIVAMTLFVFGEQIGEMVANLLGLGDLFKIAWNIGRYVLIVLLLILALAVLYYFAPNVKQRFVWISPGAVVAAVLWMIVTWAFSFYTNNFGGSSSYGVIGGVIALISWLYYSSLVLLLGAEMNGVLGQRYDPAVITDPRQKATGPQAGTQVSGGRLIGAGAAWAKGVTDSPDGAGRGRARHRPRHAPVLADQRRNATGRQDPDRGAAGASAKPAHQNGQTPANASAHGVANPGDGHQPAHSRTDAEEAPGKILLWSLIHDGSATLAKYGTRRALGSLWRSVFHTPPPPQKRE